MLLSQVPSYFKSRRDALMKMYPDSVFIFPSNQEFYRNPSVRYPFRQESNLYYLTGFEEPESYLVLISDRNVSSGYRTVLFVRPRNPEMELWEGERYGIEGAQRVFGADEAFPSEEFVAQLPDLIPSGAKVFFRIGQFEGVDREVFTALDHHRQNQGRSGKSMSPLFDPNEALSEMRLFKSAEEIATLRRVCEISAKAHRTAMETARPGMNEYEIDALIDFSARKQGCQRMGYGSIVAGGSGATCLHYRFNNQTLKEGELLLIDAGAELDYYTADITRTFPVGKRFSPAQARIYDLVLKAQKDAIAIIKPGLTLPAIHQRATEVLVEGLLSLGLLKGSIQEVINSGKYRRFYPHGTSHWLGMDVHDVGLYRRDEQPRPLEPGMVFTVEPGLYFQPSDQEVPSEYRNIGVRIEDDVVVTASGCEVMTSAAPKEREEIEALRSVS